MDINQTNQTTFEENIPLENAKVKLEETPGVDLCFMLDCTGSMGSYIKMSCDKIKDIIVQVQDAYPKSEIKIGIVAYRDIGDTNRFELLPFVNSPQSAKDFLGKLVASGGNDAPEDVNGGFQQALFKLKWENPVRLLVLIADAPCHGTEFHTFGTGGDHYPKGHKDDMSWDKIFKQLIELRIDFLFLKITGYTDLMFKKFKEYADKYGAADAEINFTQELANKASAEAQATRSAGGKAPSKAEDHFAATIAHTIKVSLNKEMKKGLQTKLNKRVEENADLVNNIKKNVADTVSKLDLEDIRSKYSDLAAKVGDCILSSNNFVDALADEDCLCLTFDIGRSQAAIADPTQIIIKNVYPSFLTAGSFFYSTEYALKKNKLAHGGFEKHAEGLILKGAASENITGVMPLYFCEENWQVAKQLMKLTIAWDVTLDPLGYSYLQIKTVPFLILAKLAEMVNEKPSVEFLKFQFEMVKRTCMKIMEDGSKEGFERKFSQEVIDLYNKYVEDASTRTIDSIANNSVFLSQLYIASECGMVPRKSETYFDEMFKGMLEEELRRKQRNFPEDFNTDEWLLKILNVDIENKIAKPVQEYIDNQDNKSALSGYEQKFLALIKETEPVEEKKVEEKITTVKVTTNGARSTSDYKQSFTNGDGYNETQTKAREEYNQTLKRVMTYLYPLRMLFTSKQAENPVNFKEWDIQSDSQFFALYIQNKLHSKNAARREAITGGIYKNPWTQSEEFINNWYNKAVEDEKAKRISRYIDSAKNSQAAVFAFSSNLNEAAGALLGTRIGLDVMKFWNKLCEGGIPLVDEKAEMMLSGHYKGVSLYQDAYGWKASRKNRNKLYRVTQKYY